MLSGIVRSGHPTLGKPLSVAAPWSSRLPPPAVNASVFMLLSPKTRGGLPTPLTTRGQAILNPKALAEGSKISLAGRHVPKPRCLSPAAHSLDIRIAGRQVPKPKCLSPAAHSLDIRIAGRQVPKPRCLSPAAHSLDISIAGCQVPKPRCLSPPLYWDG